MISIQEIQLVRILLQSNMVIWIAILISFGVQVSLAYLLMSKMKRIRVVKSHKKVLSFHFTWKRQMIAKTFKNQSSLELVIKTMNSPDLALLICSLKYWKVPPFLLILMKPREYLATSTCLRHSLSYNHHGLICSNCFSTKVFINGKDTTIPKA